MAEGLVLQFAGIGEAEYDAVNAKLDFNPKTGEGDWPACWTTRPARRTAAGWLPRSGSRGRPRGISWRTGSGRPWPACRSRA